MYIKITLEQIVKFHDYAIMQDGGLPGIKDMGHLQAIWDKPFHNFFGTELYPGLSYKAAIYLESIAQAHAFNDANKRTAVLVMLTFLALNGRPLVVGQDELFTMVLSVVTHEVDIPALAEWIENRI